MKFKLITASGGKGENVHDVANDPVLGSSEAFDVSEEEAAKIRWKGCD